MIQVLQESHTYVKAYRYLLIPLCSVRYLDGMAIPRIRDQAGDFELLPGLRVCNSATVELLDYRGFDVIGKVRVTGRGNAEVHELTVKQRTEDKPVTGEGLRSIAVQALVKYYVQFELQRVLKWDAGTEVVARGLLETSEARRLRELGPVPETLEQVGRVYRVAEFGQSAPTKAIQDTFEISRSTAGAWIGRARSAGFIPELQEVKGDDAAK